MDQNLHLLAHDLHDARVAVPQGVDADARDKVEVTLALRVIYIATLAALNDQRLAGRVVLEQMLFL
jgi:hypothetical protein